ncbi:hypothetical protein ACFX15_034587 [Malus domestica]|uniref:uncharacterized protein isoform X3 n=1 Tax=Malus domestica TaxID=3750 RepID=UPI003975BB4E
MCNDDHGGAGSLFSGDNGFDEPAWGTFDPNDDVDSVWGFNAVSTTKDVDQESKDHYFSGPGEFGLNPIRTGSSQGGGFSQKSRPFTFDDSVPEHHSQPSIQDTHRQGTRIVQNLHLTPSLGLIPSEARKILDFPPTRNTRKI